MQVSAVVGRADTSGSKQLVAFIAGLMDDKSNQKDKIKRGLRPVLPEYMVPTELVFLDKLPTTPSGKIDRKALLKVDIIVESSAQMPERSLTKTQEQVRALWETLFPGRHIALHDDFSPLADIPCWPRSWFFCSVRHSIAIFLYVCYLITRRCCLWQSASTAMLSVKRGPSIPLIVPLFRMDTNAYIGRGRVFNPWADVAHRGDRIFRHLPAAFTAIGRDPIRDLPGKSQTDKHALARLRENAMRYGIADEIDFPGLKFASVILVSAI